MVRRKLSKEHLTREEIRERVNRVMDQWQSYPDFAHLFDALLGANDNLGATEFCRLYNACHPDRAVSKATVQQINNGSLLPSYEFVAALLEHDLLNLVPDAGGGHFSACNDGAPRRVALFRAAGLIEVTPESTREWNREVLAGHQRLMACDHPGQMPTWRELMRKLVQFQTQGGRTTINGLAAEARTLTGDSGLFPNYRLEDILGQGQCVPTEKERNALYLLLDLEQAQVRYLEEGIETGLIPLQPPARTTHFARAFGKVLDTLKANGISQAQLVQRSLDSQTGWCPTTIARSKVRGKQRILSYRSVQFSRRIRSRAMVVGHHPKLAFTGFPPRPYLGGNSADATPHWKDCAHSLPRFSDAVTNPGTN